MHCFLKNLYCATGDSAAAPARPISSRQAKAGNRNIVLAIAALNLALAAFASAQIAPDMPNPISAPNPLTQTLSIFRLNMQAKIMNAANIMPESKYDFRPTKDVRSFGEIVKHVADISYYLCSNMKGVAPPRPCQRKNIEGRDRRVPQILIRLLRWRVLRLQRCAPQ